MEVRCRLQVCGTRDGIYVVEVGRRLQGPDVWIQ